MDLRIIQCHKCLAVRSMDEKECSYCRRNNAHQSIPATIMGANYTGWNALIKINRNGERDRLKRFWIGGKGNGRAVPVIADNIREEGQARLMAAAPKLLRSLKAIIKISDRDHEAWNEAKEIIKKLEE